MPINMIQTNKHNTDNTNIDDSRYAKPKNKKTISITAILKRASRRKLSHPSKKFFLRKNPIMQR